MFDDRDPRMAETIMPAGFIKAMITAYRSQTRLRYLPQLKYYPRTRKLTVDMMQATMTSLFSDMQKHYSLTQEAKANWVQSNRRLECNSQPIEKACRHARFKTRCSH